MEGFVSKVFVEVLLDQNLKRPLDYAVPENLRVEVGMRVEVPLKSTLKQGTISKIKSFPRGETKSHRTDPHHPGRAL